VTAWRWLLAIASVLVLSLGCVGDDIKSPPDDITPLPDDINPLPLVPPSDEGAGALLRGVLSLEGSCLMATEVDSGDTYLAIWPSTAQWNHSKQTVVLHGEEIMLGSVALLTGGEVPIDAGNMDRIQWVRPPHPDCLPADAWFVYRIDPDS
jgi:hypothetical protein